MSVKYLFIEQGSQKWHDEREDNYSGSNSYKLLSGILDPKYARAQDTGFGGNFHTKRGHLLEDEAIELWEEINGTKIIRDENGVKVGIVKNNKYPGCIYSPDGLTDDMLIEVKCFSKDRHMELVNGHIDMKIMAQIQYGFLITEKRVGHLIAYNPKMDNVADKFRVITVRRNPRVVGNFKHKLEVLREASDVENLATTRVAAA